jgi:hypothetical protein
MMGLSELDREPAAAHLRYDQSFHVRNNRRRLKRGKESGPRLTPPAAGFHVFAIAKT